ncbi:MAG: peptide chain release factor 1 [Clostridia bacterium]|nr:peptide chain release factor 1 [Clostridia bacterium]
MLNKLAQIEIKFEKTEAMLAEPQAAADQEKFRELMREHKKLSPIVEKYREYKKARAEEEDAELLLDEADDAEMKKMIIEEIAIQKEKQKVLSEELQILLLPRDPNDDKNVIMEIRAGAGGEEAALFAATLYRMYSMYAESVRWKTELMSAGETELGGYREISFMVTGDGAYSKLKFESGVHRVQRVPETETQGRIHTSTVTVAVLPEVEDIEIEIRPEDLQVETCKSSGAGGQHINKTESAIRIIHKPSGLVIECQEERSQHKNRDKAMKMLRAKLYDIEKTKQESAIASERKSQVGTGDRSQKIRTYNFPQNRVTDHRIGFTTHNFDGFLDGEIDEMIMALAAADAAEKLKGSADNAN